ncbi:hypothetical protein PHLGIDRAFT_269698 [Phlebiopsis gigantea 11061_1 CR5-6]|uniref:Glycoside hydrolase 131 catalytic N-terminal domain-containing protein n=1 Tax=Phlebiopsis gigantea (strain 11061_1 CR5-6) TaxID=745531 RepID=A0A0C3S194_PHLG1|nr:hypothetical protein PHLGIDRAFT_269698 [Phlebiopsis gigantea 11061_1 CR5-6]
MHILSHITMVTTCAAFATAGPVLWDGRARFNLTGADLNSNVGPFLTVVKGSENASHYSSLLGPTLAPTPLWAPRSGHLEQPVSISIDNTSVFAPGGGAPQLGFRRTEFIAANNGDHADLIPVIEGGKTAFHFSLRADTKRPLNLTHEYQVVFIEPNDGSHVFEVQLGSPYTNPTGTLPSADAHEIKLRDHALDLLFAAPFTPGAWHNFAVQVDWTNRTLAVLYSADAAPLRVVTPPSPNLSAQLGADGQGDFHFGVLKLPLVDPNDTPTEQGDVVHFGIQEGTTEALIYSGVFVENASHSISLGYGLTIPSL